MNNWKQYLIHSQPEGQVEMSKDASHTFSYQSLLPIPGRLTTSEVGGARKLTKYPSRLKTGLEPAG